MIALNQQSAQALQDPEGGDKSGVSMYKQSHGIINPPLAPQNNADILKTQLDYLGRCVNDIENGCELDLFAFFRRGIAAAGNWTFYGPNNPFAKHPELLDRFWDWEDGIVGLLLGLFPSITARKAQKGLEACARGFEEYIKADRYKEAHTLMQQRNELHLQHGVTGTYERAKFEVSIGLGINVNASIATFWLVNSVYSRPELLSRIRDEIRENALVSHGVLSAELLRQACPLLNSVYRETLRFYAPMSSVRLVQEDTIIADTYLLRKDAIVQLAGGALHQDKALWGPDAELFNPERFIHSINGSKTNPDGSTPAGKDHILHPATFRSFGGGASLCPGRHFAQMEILNLSAAMLLGFDLAPINGTAWDPLPDRKRLPLTVMKPLKEVKVKVQPRKEFEGVKWMLEL
jgi:cytochrome P450